MRWSLSLGKYAGIKVFVHWTFLILIGWIVMSTLYRGQSLEDAVWTVLFVFAIFLCVTLHEFGHALAAKRYGINTKDINLLPIGGVARLERIPENPRQELVVAIMGPMVNVVIVAILLPFTYQQMVNADIETISSIRNHNFLLNLAIVNVMLVVFNLIPAFPMDGGRVLRAILSFRLRRDVATKIAASIGQVLAIVFVFAGFFSNPFLIFIGLFIFLGAQQEATFTANKFALSGFLLKDATMTNFGLLEKNQDIATAVRLLIDGQSRNFLVMEGSIPVGTLSREELVKGLSEQGREARVEQVMNKKLLNLDGKMPLEEAYQKMQENAVSVAPVFWEKQMIGCVDMENILEFIMIRNAESA